jgi:hypothetical protein
VSSALREPVDGRVWAYFGKVAAQQCFADGLAAGRAVVHAGYLELVQQGFARLGSDQLAAFAASTEPPRCPVRQLRRVELS